ncbi:MAG TPA: hypothetical protein HPP66_02010 [Planctomycetes bacterium]|nr:hypothetical protein [Planctomycetota bacterium]
MPKCYEHKVIASATGAISAFGYGYYAEQDFAKAWQYALGGVLGGRITAGIADFLEPSKIFGPNHRSFFHGIALNGGLAAAAYNPGKEWLLSLVHKAIECDNKQEPFKAFRYRVLVGLIIGGAGGHISHLLADSITPNGLPLLC